MLKELLLYIGSFILRYIYFPIAKLFLGTYYKVIEESSDESDEDIKKIIEGLKNKQKKE